MNEKKALGVYDYTPLAKTRFECVNLATISELKISYTPLTKRTRLKMCINRLIHSNTYNVCRTCLEVCEFGDRRTV